MCHRTATQKDRTRRWTVDILFTMTNETDRAKRNGWEKKRLSIQVVSFSCSVLLVCLSHDSGSDWGSSTPFNVVSSLPLWSGDAFPRLSWAGACCLALFIGLVIRSLRVHLFGWWAICVVWPDQVLEMNDSLHVTHLSPFLESRISPKEEVESTTHKARGKMHHHQKKAPTPRRKLREKFYQTIQTKNKELHIRMCLLLRHSRRSCTDVVSQCCTSADPDLILPGHSTFESKQQTRVHTPIAHHQFAPSATRTSNYD